MKRREFLAQTTAGGIMAVSHPARPAHSATAVGASKLTPPAKGEIPVAFVISDGATMIDFAGPWEVFQDVMIPDRGPAYEDQMPFRLFTVADKAETVRVTGGMKIVPDFTVDTAPPARVVVVPAHRSSPRMLEWLRKVSQTADVTMSVCTGAFALAKAGLLSGKAATTHHDYQDRLAKDQAGAALESVFLQPRLRGMP